MRGIRIGSRSRWPRRVHSRVPETPPKVSHRCSNVPRHFNIYQDPWVREKIDILFIRLPTSLIFSQNPQVEGLNQHRYIFNAKVPSSGRPLYLARYDSDSGLVVLNAGTAHGITFGAEFTFYAAYDFHQLGKPLDTFIVNNSAFFFSTLRPANDASCQSLPTLFTVLQTKPSQGGTFCLYLPAADYSSTYRISFLHDIQRIFRDVKFVNSPDDAHLELIVRDNQLVVSVRDKKATVYGFDHKFPTIKATPHNLTSFLEKAETFYRQRDLHTNIDSEVAKIVTFNFYKLGATYSKFEDILECQLGASGANLYDGNVVDFVVEEGCYYGVKLTNSSSYDLHPTLLYFDTNDLTISNASISFEIPELISISPIETYYEPPFSGSNTLEAPLKSNGGTLTIGYGSGGSPPFSYTVPEKCNIGFLKLLVSTRPIHSTAGTWPCLCRLEANGPSTLDGGEIWETLTITMIQRRSPAPTVSNIVSSVPWY